MSRIIAGSAGGRKLTMPPGTATRPTSDRVREAFFSALAHWNGTGAEPGEEQLAGIAFLDLFAGSGAVGLEAASRGAAPVMAVESDGKTVGIITSNIEASGLSVTARHMSAETFLAAGTDHQWDVVWMDPPYAIKPEKVQHLVDLAVASWVKPDGVIVVERSSRDPLPTAENCDVWARTYGDTSIVWIAPLDSDAGSDADDSQPAGEPA